MSNKRQRNTTINGETWDDTTKKMVWSKGIVIENYPTEEWRLDYTGMIMQYSKFGAGSDYSWEIDHMKPVCVDGTDDITNLQPLNHQRNIQKGDELNWVCPE